MRYEVLIAGEWVKCSKAVMLLHGWLSYEIHEEDGSITTGLAQPGYWRERPTKGTN